jgi:hypothetical protein
MCGMPTKKKTTSKRKAKTVAVKKQTVKAVQKPLPPRKAAMPKAAQRRSKGIFMKMLGIQLVIAGSAVAVLMLLGLVEKGTFATGKSDASEAFPVTIGLEHDKPLSLGVLFARKDHAGYVILENKSNDAIHLSVPSTWSRMEVSGTTLAEVTQDIPVFGFTRWALPPHASIQMLLPEAPNAVFFDSPTMATSIIDLKMVDLPTLSASNRVVLVQKQALVQLWTTDEE